MTPQEEWSPSVFCGVSTPPPEETVPTSIPQTPNSQVTFAVRSFNTIHFLCDDLDFIMSM